VRPYRLPEKHKTEVNQQIKEMLKGEMIRTSVSQWNAPLLVVPKKADASEKLKLRIVIDFRKLIRFNNRRFVSTAKYHRNLGSVRKRQTSQRWT